MGAMIVVLSPFGEVHFHPTEGRLVMDMLWDSGVLDLGDIYITSLVKARVTAGDEGGLIEASFPYLVEEVQNVVPRFTLALGETVWQTLTGLKLKLPLYRGIWHRLADPFDWDEGLVIGTWSPAEALADPRKAQAFRRDVGEFAGAWLARTDGG